MAYIPSYSELVKRVRELEALLFNDGSPAYAKAIQDSEARFKALSEAASEGIFITENGICIESNKSGCELFGYEYEEVIGKNALDVFADESKEVVLENIKKENTDKYEAIAVRKDGSLFNVEIQGYNYLYRGRNVRIASIRDITEQKKAQKALIESEMKFREVVENAGDGILISNLNKDIIEVNKSFLKMTGYTREELLYKPIKMIFSPEALRNKPLRFDLLNKGQSVIIEREIVGKGDVRIPVEMNSKRTHANYYLAIIRDLSERKRSEEKLIITNKELIAAKEKAEESDRLKSAFLANMSHEIRTPMNGIIGFAELLKSSDCSNETHQEYLDVIISSGHQLLHIINDVLEISRIETGQVKLVTKPIVLNKLIQELQLFFTPAAEKNKNKIETSLPSSEVRIEGDEAKVKQVLTNLINNAIKFTESGVVRIILKEDQHQVSIAVSDTGIGIPPDYMSKIFDRFLQVDTENLLQGGTGLGLSISQKLVELMQGEIWVKSNMSSGSIFTFTLPISPKS